MLIVPVILVAAAPFFAGSVGYWMCTYTSKLGDELRSLRRGELPGGISMAKGHEQEQADLAKKILDSRVAELKRERGLS
jgi:hypothetical protein